MTGKTHRLFALAFLGVSFEVMRYNGLLLHQVDPLLQLSLMYGTNQYGAIFPDNDHHADAMPSKMPINIVVHRLIRLTRPKHRSWQTHSILVTGGFLLLLWALVTYGVIFDQSLTPISTVILRLLVYGFISGVASHLLADALNPSGIWIWPGLKIRLVPKFHFFATGGTWETKVISPLSILIFGITGLDIVLGEFGYSLLSLLKLA